MNQTELAAKLDAATAKIGKISTEVQALLDAITAGGNVSPEVEAAMANVESALQGLDDKNVDA